MSMNSQASRVASRLIELLAQTLDRRIGWHRLPTPLALAVLVGLRQTLRSKNLFDTEVVERKGEPPNPASDAPTDARSSDGSNTDLKVPVMGMANTRFGRNIPLEKARIETAEQILDPNPRELSRKLLTRSKLVPASSVNALVAPWLQFMVQDWFNHGTHDFNNAWEISIDQSDDWPSRPMRVPKLRPDPTRENVDIGPPTYLNTETHWWDASQLYGSNGEQQKRLRTGQGGKVETALETVLAPSQTQGAGDPSSVPGFWYGIFMMHEIFRKEHNAICDRLRAERPYWDDEKLFQHARLVNAALIAKIHTVEWTPAVISHPATKLALRVNWWGLAGERAHRIFGRISPSEVISGIPGSPNNHHGVPFSITEEFSAVYRMHPLMPDNFDFRSLQNNGLIESRTLRSLAGAHAMAAAKKFSMDDAFYTLGTMHPGLVTLHNFPTFLQKFERPDGAIMDLAATDILRIREQGVPRYNEFRRLLHLSPARDFFDLTDNAEDAQILSALYDADIEKVDLMIGMYAEKRPEGFAFSDTAFRIFIVMASRRLNSDRFFTDDYRPEVYTKAGMDWIEDNGMATVLKRHYPMLAEALRDVGENAFLPWRIANGVSNG